MPVNDLKGGYEYPEEVQFEIEEQDLSSYQRAADFLNISNADIVCVQHELGIYDGPAGSHLLALLRELKMPVVTTLHTVLREPNSDQRRVMQELIARSTRLVVMAERGRQMLLEVYQSPPEKIDFIPHGIPDISFVDPNYYKDQFGEEGRTVLLTFGLLSPNKGIEHVLDALPPILAEFPDVVYIVLGATHPNEVREQGEAYRLGLERLAKKNKVEKNVIFYNRFVELEELKEFIGAADIYITPYLNEAQITSGTLAYTFGAGKAVISTPYWHATELLADERGVLVPFGDAGAIAREVIGLLRDETRRTAMARLMGLYDRTTQPEWPWFDEELAYDNARLAQALMVSGRAAGQPAVFERGLLTLFPRLDRFNRAAAAASDLGATMEEKKEEQKKAPTLEVKDSRGTSSVLNWTGTLLAGLGESLVLLYFLLASGDLFLQKLVHVMPTMHDKKSAVEISHEIQQNISHYLFSVSLINIGMGLVVGGGLFFLGVPNAAMWGVCVAVLNFVPYFGPVAGVIVLAAVGLLTFNTLWQGLLPPAWYLGLHALEANLITPVLLGRRFTLNPVVLFVSLIFWMWLWGVPGALLSVPILVSIKVVCDRVPALSPVSELLSR